MSGCFGVYKHRSFCVSLFLLLLFHILFVCHDSHRFGAVVAVAVVVALNKIRNNKHKLMIDNLGCQFNVIIKQL